MSVAVVAKHRLARTGRNVRRSSCLLPRSSTKSLLISSPKLVLRTASKSNNLQRPDASFVAERNRTSFAGGLRTTGFARPFTVAGFAIPAQSGLPIDLASSAKQEDYVLL